MLTWLVFLHMSRQLHGHLTYFLPEGAFLIGVASLQWEHFTTCCSRFPEMSIVDCNRNVLRPSGVNKSGFDSVPDKPCT